MVLPLPPAELLRPENESGDPSSEGDEPKLLLHTLSDEQLRPYVTRDSMIGVTVL